MLSLMKKGSGHGATMLLDNKFQQILMQPQQHVPAAPESDKQLDATAGSCPHHVRRRPAWMSDYEVTKIDDYKDTLTHLTLFSDCDPTNIEAAIKRTKVAVGRG